MIYSLFAYFNQKNTRHMFPVTLGKSHAKNDVLFYQLSHLPLIFEVY